MIPAYPSLRSVAAFFCAALVTANASPLKVLYYTQSSGWVHDMVKRENDQPSPSEQVLLKLGAANDLQFTFSKDGSHFTKEYLGYFDVIMFYTSGDLCSVGTDGNPGISNAGLNALFDAIAGGKGFVAVHSASDTFHTNERGGGNPPIREQRFKAYGENSDPYLRMLGGEFIRHGKQQVAKARVIDPKFPGCADLGADLEMQEEWYTLKDFAPDIHVLLVMETGTMEGVDYARAPYPLAWARLQGKGRVWFNAMGHRQDVWDNPKFQSMLLGGLNWAGGRAEAAITPNLKEAAPGFAEIQAFAAPKPAK